jgi:hypothetical protein
MLKSILTVALLLVSQLAVAQDGTLTAKTPETKSSYPVSVLLLGDALALNGAGLKATYKVSDKFSAGVIGKTYQLKSDDEYKSWSTSSKTELSMYGLVVDFFPMNSTDRRGLYVSGAVTSVSAKTTVSDTLYGEGSSDDQRVGGQLTVGYQFVINIANTTNILFQVGGGYGNGGAVEHKYFTGANTTIRDSLLLDLSAGAQF